MLSRGLPQGPYREPHTVGSEGPASPYKDEHDNLPWGCRVSPASGFGRNSRTVSAYAKRVFASRCILRKARRFDSAIDTRSQARIERSGKKRQSGSKGARRMPHTAFVGLGSNLGDCGENLERACAALRQLPGLAVTALSPVYITEPQGMKDQPWFANRVARLAVSMSAEALLERLSAVETALGRTRSDDPALRYGPRVIDLDLLLFDALRVASPTLTLPHPRLEERAFVLVPLRDIAPDLRLPSGRTCDEALAELCCSVDGNRIRQQQTGRSD